MNNYTALNEKILEELTDFTANISKGLGKVDTHFLCDIINGIVSNNSIILSDIVRTSGMNNIKKGVERLERHLDSFDEIANTVQDNYSSIVKPLISPRKLYFVDGGDVTKDENTKFENLGYVLDGSDEHKLARGYKIFEIDTIDNANQPINLISDLRTSDKKVNDSNKELSENTEWLKRMEKVSNTYGKGTFILDRGFDGAILMENIIEMDNDFIVRAKCLTRKVYVNGVKTTISNLARTHKGFYKFDTNIHGKITHLKVSSVNIKIQSQDAKNINKHLLTLVIVKGYGDTDAYMALITSRKVSGKDQVLQVVKDYISRWKIEDNFKFKKQQYGLEKIKVRRYKRIQVMNYLLSMVMLFNNIINLKALGKTLRRQIIQIRKYVHMWLYRLADGIKKIIDINTTQIIEKLHPKRKPRRRDLFTVMHVPFRMA